MASFRSLLIAFLLVGLFLYAMINFGALLSSDNDLNQSILDDERVSRSFSNLNDTIRGTASEKGQQTIANDTYAGFEEQEPEVSQNILFTAIVGVGKTFRGALIGVYNIVFIFTTETFGLGNDEIIIGVLTTIIIATIGLLLWRLYRGGE